MNYKSMQKTAAESEKIKKAGAPREKGDGSCLESEGGDSGYSGMVPMITPRISMQMLTAQ